MRRICTFLVLSAAALSLAACAGTEPTFLRPAGYVAARQADLFWRLMILSVLVLGVVWGVLIYVLARFRPRGPREGIPRQTYRHLNLEAIWTGIPFAMSMLVLFWTFTTMNEIAVPEQEPTDVQLRIIGQHWWFEFVYPDVGVVTANELHVPVGHDVQIELISPHVIHSFWIPQLSGKTDVIPGIINRLWFRADRLGEYHGQCGQFCGIGHAYMRIKTVVQTEDEYQAWLTAQMQPPPEPTTPEQQAGHMLIAQGLCHSCHTLGDQVALQPIAPNLTHLMSRSVFAGASYPLTEDNLRRWLQDNDSMKPGNLMSAVRLTPEQIDAAMAYLVTLE